MHYGIYWKAVYDDGTELLQFEEDGTENKYVDIDRHRLKFFDLFKGTRLIFRLHLEEGRRLICRARHSGKIKTMILRSKTKPAPLKPAETIWLVGWQQTIGGENIQDIAYIFEDGHVELAGKWKDERIFQPVENLLECEKKVGGIAL